MRQNAARVQLAAQFNERRQEGNAYTYIFRSRNRGFQEAFRRIPRRRFDSTHNDSPCLRDEKRWESAKQNATSNFTTIHHVCAMRRGGKVRRSGYKGEGQIGAFLAFLPAWFSWLPETERVRRDRHLHFLCSQSMWMESALVICPSRCSSRRPSRRPSCQRPRRSTSPPWESGTGAGCQPGNDDGERNDDNELQKI